MTSCPDENALAELVQGISEAAIAGELEVHLDGCEDCRRIVSSVGQSSYVAQRPRAPDSHPPTASMAPARMHVDAPAPGTVLAGKYRVERVLGQGGMGIVLAATHLTLRKLVALKLMRCDLAADPGAAQRFVREARAASLLRSEHIVRVIDLDALPDGTPYMAMEYLVGEDLDAMLARRGRISAEEAATYLLQVCDAIAEAHAAGIVHRDLKPANLFVTERAHTPCVKVLDFGISKIIAGGPRLDDAASTDTRSLVGSPHYMAPEQLISAKSVDPRTDIWALGCILYELVSGVRPFATSEAVAEVLASILRDPVPSLRTRCSDLPDEFGAIVERCLEKDPARRFQRVDELVAALARLPSTWTANEPATAIDVRAPTPTVLGTPAPAARSSTSPRVALEPGPRRRRMFVVLAIAAFAVGAVVRFGVLRGGDDVGDTPLAAAPAPIVAPAPAPIAATAPPRDPVPAMTTPMPAASPSHTPHKKPRTKRLEDDLIGPSFH